MVKKKKKKKAVNFAPHSVNSTHGYCFVLHFAFLQQRKEVQELSRGCERPSVQTEKYSSCWSVPQALPV